MSAAPYHARCWGHRCHLTLPKEEREGDWLADGWHCGFAAGIYRCDGMPWTLGLSGPFGNAAVDWRSGEKWRPASEILDDLEPLAVLEREWTDWFDIHASLELTQES